MQPGAIEEEPIRLRGEGSFAIGSRAVDVVFMLRFTRHEYFERRGADLIVSQQLSLGEALGGARLLVRQLDGRRLLVTTAPGDVLHPSGAGSIRRVKGEGMPRRDGTTGDLLIKFAIRFPQPGDLSAEDQAALLALLSRDSSGENGGFRGDESNGASDITPAATPPVRVPDGDTETEAWDVNGADGYVMESVDGVGDEYEFNDEDQSGEPRVFFGGRRGPWVRRSDV